MMYFNGVTLVMKYIRKTVTLLAVFLLITVSSAYGSIDVYLTKNGIVYDPKNSDVFNILSPRFPVEFGKGDTASVTVLMPSLWTEITLSMSANAFNIGTEDTMDTLDVDRRGNTATDFTVRCDEKEIFHTSESRITQELPYVFLNSTLPDNCSQLTINLRAHEERPGFNITVSIDYSTGTEVKKTTPKGRVTSPHAEDPHQTSTFADLKEPVNVGTVLPAVVGFVFVIGLIIGVILWCNRQYNEFRPLPTFELVLPRI